MAPATLALVATLALAGRTPSDPMALARLVGDAFFKESTLPPAPAPGLKGAWPQQVPVGHRAGAHAGNGDGRGYGMLAWNYGGALILDGMYESVKQVGARACVRACDGACVRDL